MKRKELFHPRVFDDEQWAEGYFKRNARNIRLTGERLADVLKKSGFKGGKILDAGCGFGAVGIEMAKAFPNSEITGIDLSEPLLKLAEKSVDSAGIKTSIIFRKGDVEKIDFPDKHFDLVINSFMLHIVENPVVMLNEIERVAKPDARILITDLRRFWLGYFAKKFSTTFTLNEATVLIQQSKLRMGTAKNGPFWWDYFCGI